ncbi:leucine-rich repeat receptor-like serine/threonine/tyrosine-protein kinase SOBIR1 [Malania oleifera]|uniref:leucine-rich repeat receptor-like serine/threonine/tyrosine-protein kinase SOBIR1 n=1 Tax=Malania oleifera TaxID=397392 RepID=UPI0025ADE7AC|nr:leucine-rich repeat receptor-like serine/threonine/tyrosine-protein kinase SOBIR1 [Malania oleifera]
MAFAAGNTTFPLLTFFSLLILANAKLNLHHPDHDAILTLQKDLGIAGQQLLRSVNPCDADGVHCERRLAEGSYVLRITRIVFESRRLTGSISPAIGKLSELREISLQNNHLVDRLPPQIVDCAKLEILNLRNNRFSGEIPSEFSSLLRLRILDLSANRFSGNLNFLKYFPNLETLSLADNHFTGKIPTSLRSFRNLRTFNFSGNILLEGSTPATNRVNWVGYDPSSKRFASPENSNWVNRHNRVGFESVPKRFVLTENSNRIRAKAPTQAPSPATGAVSPGPSAAPIKHKKSKNKIGGWVLGFFVGAVAGIVSGIVFSVLFKLLMLIIKGKGKDSGPAIFSPQIKKAEDLAFLERDDGLASLQIIGKGGSGEVYKAELPGSNGKMIAIKKIVQPPKEAAELADEESRVLNKKMRQIRSEINTVGKIRHRNLLPLLAHVCRPDCHYLVYEFMKNGSLQDLMNDVAVGRRDLDWPTRHRIAVGVAAGLEYLHTCQSPRIIHRDLKPGNVLLDDEMEARISDFGLAKAMPDANTHVTSSNVAGTVGYIAPEYHQTLKFTDKCDIYSFGVLLGVLVVGRLPSDDFFQNTAEMSLVKWMRNVMTSEDPGRAVDERLMGNGFEEQMLLVLKIACFCTLDDPKQRPNSKDVRCMLAQIKH